MTLRKRIRPHARAARRWVEELAKRDEVIYDDMCGGCAVASAYLLNRLVRAGIPARAVIGPGHCHVRVRGIYVDVTATQFGLRRVFVSRQHPQRTHVGHNGNSPWSPMHTAQSVSELVTRLYSCGWSGDARAVTHYVIQKRRTVCGW